VISVLTWIIVILRYPSPTSSKVLRSSQKFLRVEHLHQGLFTGLYTQWMANNLFVFPFPLAQIPFLFLNSLFMLKELVSSTSDLLNMELPVSTLLHPSLHKPNPAFYSYWSSPDSDLVSCPLSLEDSPPPVSLILCCRWIILGHSPDQAISQKPKHKP
jgi:hypothetical protein